MKKILFTLLLIPCLVFGQATGKVISDKPSGGSIGSAATTVDVLTNFNLNQTTAGQTLTIPNLTNASAGKIIYINNVGSVQLTLSPGGILPAGYGVVLRWTGASWGINAPPTDLTDIETHLDSLSANKIAYSDTVSTIATQHYIDSVFGGVAEPPVFFADAATTAALPTVTYSSGTLTATSNGRITDIDGVKLEIDDFLLTKNQAAGLQNGGYQVIDTGTASTPFILARPSDYDESAELYPSIVSVSQGTANGGRYFSQTTVDPVIGTNSIVYILGSRPPSPNYPGKFAHVYTESALPNSPTYANGSNVNFPAHQATLTATTNGAFPTLQGVVARSGLVVIVNNQVDQTKNGTYKILVKGSSTTKWKIQRVEYSASLLYPHVWIILEGTGKGKLYHQDNKSLVNLNIGTSGNITFTEIRSFLNTTLTGTTTATAVNTTSLTATTASVTTTSTASITATASSIVPTMSYPSNTTNSASTAYVTTAIAAIPPSVVNAKTLYVSPIGSDADATRAGHLGKITSAFLTLEAAQTAATSGDLIYVFPGTYTVTTTATAGLAKDGVSYYFEPGCVVNKSTAGAMFKMDGFTTGFSVFGYADFNKTGTANNIWVCNADVPFSMTFECRDITNTTAGLGSVYYGCIDMFGVYSYNHQFRFRNAISTGGGCVSLNYSTYATLNFSSIRSTAGVAVLCYEGSSNVTLNGNLIESTTTYGFSFSWAVKAAVNVANVNGITYGINLGGVPGRVILNGNTNGVYGSGGFLTVNGVCENINISGGRVKSIAAHYVTMTGGSVQTKLFGGTYIASASVAISGGYLIIDDIEVGSGYGSTMTITGGKVIINGYTDYYVYDGIYIDGATADVTINSYTDLIAFSGVSRQFITLTNGTLRLKGTFKQSYTYLNQSLVKWVGGKLIMDGATFVQYSTGHVMIESRTASQTLRVYGGGVNTNAPENSGLLAGKKHKWKFTVDAAANTTLYMNSDGVGGTITTTVLVSGFATKALIAQEFVAQINASGAVALLASQDTPGTDEYFYVETDTAGPLMILGSVTNLTQTFVRLGSYEMTEVCGGVIIEDTDVQ